jgi:hypothetical protein
LIAIAIGFGMVDGCPLPRPDATPEWEKGFVEPIRSVQHVVETPVAWIGAALRVSQQWALYQHPGADRWRIWIEGQTSDGAWHILYRAGDDDHDEDADVMESGRVWGAYTDGTPPQYTAFCHWITSRMLERHPELAAVRVQLEPVKIRRGGFEPTGKFEHGFIHPRGLP